MERSGLNLDAISSLSIDHNVLWIIFGLLVFIFLIVSAILLFHWRRYGMKNSRIILSETIYLIGGGIFLFSALVALLKI